MRNWSEPETRRGSGPYGRRNHRVRSPTARLWHGEAFGRRVLHWKEGEQRMRTLEFIGTVRESQDNSSQEIVVLGRDELIIAPTDWPQQLAPGSLHIEVNAFPEGFATIGEGEGLKKLDNGSFRPELVIPKRKIAGKTLEPDADHPTRGFAQVWRAEIQVIASSQATTCWMLRIIGTESSAQLELVAEEGVLNCLGRSDGTAVRVTVREAESQWEPMTPLQVIADWCEAAQRVDEGFGPEKAMGYLIGEKFLNFLEVAETKGDWRQAIPSVVANIKALFEPWRLAEFMHTPRRLGVLGHTADDEGHRMLREALDESEKAREDARNLILFEWATELLLSESEEGDEYHDKETE
jgi:hypothetical protein